MIQGDMWVENGEGTVENNAHLYVDGKPASSAEGTAGASHTNQFSNTRYNNGLSVRKRWAYRATPDCRGDLNGSTQY
jgi:hypothetical protein